MSLNLPPPIFLVFKNINKKITNKNQQKVPLTQILRILTIFTLWNIFFVVEFDIQYCDYRGIFWFAIHQLLTYIFTKQSKLWNTQYLVWTDRMTDGRTDRKPVRKMEWRTEKPGFWKIVPDSFVSSIWKINRTKILV